MSNPSINSVVEDGERESTHPFVVTYWAHSTAVIDEPVSIGDGTKVWHFSHVMGGARIGSGCSLGQNVYVAATVVVGSRCKVQNNVSLYDGVELADDVFVGPSAVFTNVVNPRAFVARKDEYLPTKVGKGASIGANATIVCGCSVGEYAFVAAGAVVTRDVPAYALVVGVPARVVGWTCRCGERLPPVLVCAACGSGYREYREGEALRLSPAPAIPGG